METAEFFLAKSILRNKIMKKIAKISGMFAAIVFAFLFAGCSSGDDDSNSNDVIINDSSSGGTSSRIPERFVKIPAVSITGTESWSPKSSVFVSGRVLEIASFYMSDHEVTRAEYKAVMESDPSTADAYDKNGDKLTSDDVKNNPVNCIKWYDAIVYCNKRSIKEKLTPCYVINNSTNPDDWGSVPYSKDEIWNAVTCDFNVNGYRLPTAAEWEWAARGGENYTYAGSNKIDEVAWYTVNTNKTGTRDVKAKNANGYGLYDMSGNISEWCWDWSDIIDSSTPSTGPLSSASTFRCRLGGSWDDVDEYCLIGFLVGSKLFKCYDTYGFRVVRTAK